MTIVQCDNWFDYWGKGTSVTVSTESPRAPSLFPLIPSGDSTGDTEIAIGCLAKNFLPDTVTFSWDNSNNSSIGDQKFMKFPSIMSGGTYTAASQAKVSRSTWEALEPFYCKAKHAQGDKVVSVAKPYVVQQPHPEMLIRAPVLNAFSSSYLNSTVTCEVSNLCSGNVAISWLKEQKEITSGITTSKPVPNGRGGYTIWSKLVVTKEDWISEKKFACAVKSKEFTHSETFSLPSFCKRDVCSSVSVETIPPTFADMFLTSSANLTCKISNIPTEADYSKLNVTWTRASDQKQLHTVMTNFLIQENDFYYVNAVATVCATEWKEDETFHCKVTFEDVLVKPIEKPLRKENDGELKAPSVYILSPSVEQVNLREKATLSCLIQGFNPNSIFVRWLHNEEPISESEYFTSQPIVESNVLSKQYFAYSILTVSEQEWSAGDSYTCMVGHEALAYNTVQKTVNKNTGYIEGIVDTEDEEEFQNLSSILSTFIILFLVSLFYSATVTVIKVK
ncbi:hypothetical protein NXF25_021562 [Crotalus adamanteus]|uniref:Ig-like domain-containing protein n=1 Tax=Crotalus adamanteus TaxID=8729 RepID=A0AAW1B8T6_CROAD